MLHTNFCSFGQAVSEEKIFRNRPIRNENCLWWPCLLTDQDDMSNLYRRPSIDASYKFLFIWPSGFRGEDFQKSTNQKRELPVVAMFVNGSGRYEHFNRGPSIDASYQVSVHLAEWLQRRRLKCEKVTDNRLQVMAKVHIAFVKVS